MPVYDPDLDPANPGPALALVDPIGDPETWGPPIDTSPFPDPFALPTLRLTVEQARERDLLCVCGDGKADPGWYTNPDLPGSSGLLVLPLRSTGGERGHCGCFRARTRQTPIGANR